MNWLAIFIGGGLGSVLRYGLGLLWKQNSSTFPYSTLLANVTSCIIIGILILFPLKQNNNHLWLLLSVGFCGGLSTFSTFSMETILLFREGNHLMAWTNILLSMVLCLTTVWFISKSGISPAV